MEERIFISTKIRTKAEWVVHISGTMGSPLSIRRNESKIIKMEIIPDTEVCERYDSITYTYEWIIFIVPLIIPFLADSHLKNNTNKVTDIDHEILTNKELVIPRYTLAEGPKTLLFQLKVKDKGNSLVDNKPNMNMCYVNITIDGLHAEIVGSPVRNVSSSYLITLDASLSYNPNEPSHKQDQDIHYIWRCDVEADNVNCKEHTSTSRTRQLPGLLDKAKKYVFKLITRVSDEYAKRVGKPKDGTAEIILLPKAISLDISIKCVKNCRHLSRPSEIFYLMAQTKSNINCSLEWYYKENSEAKFISAKKIRELDTPSHIFISIKSSLDYNKVYTFKVKDSISDQESSTIIRTEAKPISGNCQLIPASGMAGKTLFNLTCSKYLNNDVLSYYYYEWYENVNDRSELSLLMDWGSNALSNIILPTSGKIGVLAINSFKTYAYFNISVQIFKSNDSELVKMFKRMKVEMKNGYTSATIRILSLICDVLLDTRKADGFSILLNTLSKIRSKKCISCIEQTALALTKVVYTCSVVNDHKIKSADALAISSNLLHIASNLFEYLKTLQSDAIRGETEERIERIYNCLKIIIDVLIKDTDPVINNHNSSNAMRYFWSSLNNMVLLTQNIELTLTIFGESILLHQFLFEKPKIYESTELYFWSNILDADKLKKQNNTFSSTLVEELLSDKRQAWGLKIFEIDKKLAIWTHTKNYSNEVNSNIKYLALSSYDQPINGKYLGLIHEFISPVLITFNITKTMRIFNNYKTYTIVVPAAGSKQIEIDKAIHVFRFDMTEIGAITVTIKDSSRSLLVAWTRDRRPDSELMADEQYTTKISAGDNCQITFQTNKDYQNYIHYIGIFVDTTANDYSTPNNLDEIKFKMNMVCMQCLYWKDGAWSSKGLEIGHNSSVDGNVQCYAYHLSMFKSSIFVIPDLINPFDEIHLFSTIANNMVCLILVSIIFILYFVLLYWSSVNDKNDIFKNRVIILDDNHMGEDEVYLVTVYTGHWLGSGTSANVCIELNGTICKSRPHWLHSLDDYPTMQRSNDDWFIIFTPQSLGELQSIHIWHDNYGTNPDWYCQEIIVTEVRSNKLWVFEVEQWFSIREPTKNIEHTVYASNSQNNWTKKTKKYVEMGIRENHLWASVFIRHPRSPITRCQRLSVILCSILCLMLSSMMFYEKVHTNEENFQKFELKLREIIIAIQSGIVQYLLTFGVHKCFRKGRLVQLNKIKHNTGRQETQMSDNEHQSTSKKAFVFIIERLVENKLYYPVHTEMITEISQWNYWFIIGWSCCIIVYVITVFFIILYGLKFGRVKSLCWLTSITIGILQGVVVSTPFKIVLMSAVIATYDSRTVDQFMTFRYYLTLHKYRNKTQTLLQDVEYVRAIRNYRRRRYFYEPLTRKTAEILRERRNLIADRNNAITDGVICIVLILTSLGFLHNLKVFNNRNDKYRTNQMVSVYLERGFTSNNRRINLNDLKNVLLLKLLKSLHSLELYNGVPISNNTMDTIKYDKRGWFGLYNSRLVGGGVRFRQKRINMNGEIDHRNYGAGWTEYNDNDMPNNPWTYSKPANLRNFLFYENRMASDDDSGYELHVTGGLINGKLTIDEYAKQKWLDARVRRFYVRFQIYTPDVDLITVIEIRVSTGCGLTYTIITDVVQTVPASSVIAEWDIFAFTVTASGFLLIAGVACLLVRIFRWSIYRRWIQWSTAYDGLLITLITATVAAFYKRLTVMEQATTELSSVTDDVYVDLWPACYMHSVCTFFTTILMAAALLKISIILWRERGWPRMRTQ
ncbi:uncharacterized protein LOC126552720 isoform X6 [Aphis gossypii]|uniref:uncharacterized protein LOC126552720 isoform X6 n=1 Tax=Aphis gossypii TaxID=80765 RepID=UPI00215962B9|nr:uncharacterized protein LOC126552720 isoform X6 [Aphis gossypii]XP_050063462.1 uncharacterized protein LOC126552720 isoform X6 [Aphis gossypii]